MDPVCRSLHHHGLQLRVGREGDLVCELWGECLKVVKSYPGKGVFHSIVIQRIVISTNQEFHYRGYFSPQSPDQEHTRTTKERRPVYCPEIRVGGPVVNFTRHFSDL